MAFVKSSARSGKKQACVPGPNSAAYKKALAAKKGKGQKTHKTGKKSPKAGSTYSSVKSRQMLVERMKREIWASVLVINQAIIGLAELGNLQAAKALFDFAGVYSLPEPEEAASVAPVAVLETQPAQSQPVDALEALFRSMGGEDSSCDAEPSVAGAGR